MTKPPPIPTNGKSREVWALVISGGGSKGQYAVGAVKYLLGELGRDFKIYSGVSVGALIAAYLSQFGSGQEREAANGLESLFSPIKNKDIWKRWGLGYLAGALWKPSFKNSDPLEGLIRKHLDPMRVRSSCKELRVGATSLTSGEYVVFDQTHVPLVSAVAASAAFPGFFKPVRIRNEWWVDGGVRTVTPLKAAMDAGATHIVYITLAPEKPSHGFEQDPEGPDVAFRSIELMNDQVTRDDIKIAEMYNELAAAGLRPDKREVKLLAIRPKSSINGDSLHFDPVEAQQAQLRGYRDTIEALNPS